MLVEIAWARKPLSFYMCFFEEASFPVLCLSMLCLSKAAMDRTEATPGILAEILNAEYDVLFNIGCLLPFNDDPLRKKNKEKPVKWVVCKISNSKKGLMPLLRAWSRQGQSMDNAKAKGKGKTKAMIVAWALQQKGKGKGKAPDDVARSLDFEGISPEGAKKPKEKEVEEGEATEMPRETKKRSKQLEPVEDENAAKKKKEKTAPADETNQQHEKIEKKAKRTTSKAEETVEDQPTEKKKKAKTPPADETNGDDEKTVKKAKKKKGKVEETSQDQATDEMDEKTPEKTKKEKKKNAQPEDPADGQRSRRSNETEERKKKHVVCPDPANEEEGEGGEGGEDEEETPEKRPEVITTRPCKAQWVSDGPPDRTKRLIGMVSVPFVRLRTKTSTDSLLDGVSDSMKGHYVKKRHPPSESPPPPPRRRKTSTSSPESSQFLVVISNFSLCSCGCCSLFGFSNFDCISGWAGVPLFALAVAVHCLVFQIPIVSQVGQECIVCQCLLVSKIGKANNNKRNVKCRFGTYTEVRIQSHTHRYEMNMI
jgi:hypothetical protein